MSPGMSEIIDVGSASAAVHVQNDPVNRPKGVFSRFDPGRGHEELHGRGP
jgi:hypothetical protein